MRTTLFLAAMLAALSGPAPARAYELGSGRLSLNGFGSWAAGYTNRNAYQTGTVPGQWNNADFAFDVAAQPDERLSVAAQVFFRSGGEAGETSGRIDWAFASWRFSDAVTLRVGKVKQPFGIYGEIYDVGTLRPFLTLPAGLYGPADFVGESYLGAGLTGNFFSSSGWGLGYDVYLGELVVNEAELPKFVAHPELFQPGAAIDIEEESHGRQAGARLTLHTPVDGLSFRLTGAGRPNGPTVAGVSAEYLTDVWSIRSEVFHQHDPAEEVQAWAGYLEVARHFGRHWQLATRLDLSRTLIIGQKSDSSLLRHRDLALGLNYWFTPQLVFRVAAHAVDGNRFAYAGDVVAATLARTLASHTALYEIGAQFAF
jgi:hypothetical protein